MDSDDWRQVRDGWQDPFTPSASSRWDDFPAFADLFPWVSQGITASRTWVYSPSAKTLSKRWQRLVSESDPKLKKKLFKESRDAHLDLEKEPLPKLGVAQGTGPFREESGPAPAPVPVAYRSFDRQYLIPDSRLIHCPRTDLWAAQGKRQIYASELHTKPLSSGPGVTFTALVPDVDHFKGSEGGRTLPLFHPDGSPNVADGLLDALGELYSETVAADDLLAYAAGVAGHRAFVPTFADELTTPGIRIAITADIGRFKRAVELGRRVLWLHTYGEATHMAPEDEDLLFDAKDPRRPTMTSAMKGMPERFRSADHYDADQRQVNVGEATFAPVSPEVVDYEVGGRNVVASWLGYRRREPAGRRSSPLDSVNPSDWPAEWSREFVRLITVLQKLVDQEPAQAELLEEILAGEVFTMDELAKAGVKWPKSRADRKPRYPQDESDLLAEHFVDEHGEKA